MSERREYLPRGYTREACPGCGDDKELRPRRGVCDVCRSILLNARQRAKENRANGTEVRLVSEVAHWMPYLSERGVYDNPIRRAFHDLLLAASEHEKKDAYEGGEPLPTPSDYDRGSSGYSARNLRRFPKALIGPLGALYDAVREGLVAAYEAGKGDGSHLLMQLRRGEISPNDFDERRKRNGR